MNAISTISNLSVDINNPQPSSIDIYDIAWHLSRINRFLGATTDKHGLNVAQHSFWVADYLYHQTQSAQLAMHGLLHDSAEAYLGDVPTPLKALDALQGPYKALEKRLLTAIYKSLKLNRPGPVACEVVKDADQLALAIEARKYTMHQGATWPTAKLEIDHLVDSYFTSSAEQSRRNFISAYHFLNSKIQAPTGA